MEAWRFPSAIRLLHTSDAIPDPRPLNRHFKVPCRAPLIDFSCQRSQEGR